jgi:hypothetical protein
VPSLTSIDFHTEIKKKEVAPDGSGRPKCLDISAGVLINLFSKTGKKKLMIWQMFFIMIYLAKGN